MSMAPRVAVVGGGAPAWLAAASLARALRHRDVRVTVIDTGDADSPAGDWTLPSSRGMHKLLGIREGDFLRVTGASFRLGSEHQGWQGEGSGFVHSHGSIGKDLQGVPFYKLLLGRRIAGERLPTDVFSLASAALRMGRFARPEGDASSMTSGFTYGYHVPLRAYATLIAELARANGVLAVQGALEHLHRDESGHLLGVTAGGQRIDADLFVDCSGSRGQLISQMGGEQRIDWSANLPCDRLMSGVGPPPAAHRAATETRAVAAGWMWRIPLAASSVGGYVYQSGVLGDAEAAAQLRQACGVAEPVVKTLRSGRRRQLWVNNVVALGEAAMELEPLAGATLHFAQVGVATLIELFPLEAGMRVEAGEYNRLMGEEADALRDFTLAHYLCATRAEPLWQQVRAAPAPDRLAARMELFKANGRILVFDQETFEETDWASLFLGSGWLPVTLEAQIALRVARVTSAEAGLIADQVRGLAESMPPHPVYLRHASQPRAG